MSLPPGPRDHVRPVAAVRPRLAIAVWAAWNAVVVVTALGFLAPLVPALDLVNHFRMGLAAASLLLFAGALVARDHRLLRPTVVLMLVQAALALLPLSFAGSYESGRTATLRILTFNMYIDNNRFDEIADYVTSSGADIVVLVEVSCAAAERLIPRLKPHYPHALVSADSCFGIALLSKRPIVTSGQVIVAPRQRPLFVWTRFDWDGIPVVVTGAHPIPPLAPNDQASQITRLINHVDGFKEAQIIAGDFNLTPFSWTFARLVKAGLGQHVSYRPTWAPVWMASWLPPLFTIDNVLTTRNMAATRVAFGPALGSDHRPIIVDLALAK